MSANQACFPVATMARVLGVSKAGYYAWVHRPGPSAHATADAALLKRVRTVHAIRARGRPTGRPAFMPSCKGVASSTAASGSHD